MGGAEGVGLEEEARSSSSSFCSCWSHNVACKGRRSEDCVTLTAEGIVANHITIS